MRNPIDLLPIPTAGVLRSPSKGGPGVTTRGSCPTVGNHEPHSPVKNAICVKGGTHPRIRDRASQFTRKCCCQPQFVKFLPHLYDRLTMNPARIVADTLT